MLPKAHSVEARDLWGETPRKKRKPPGVRFKESIVREAVQRTPGDRRSAVGRQQPRQRARHLRRIRGRKKIQVGSAPRDVTSRSILYAKRGSAGSGSGSDTPESPKEQLRATMRAYGVHNICSSLPLPRGFVEGREEEVGRSPKRVRGSIHGKRGRAVRHVVGGRVADVIGRNVRCIAGYAMNEATRTVYPAVSRLTQLYLTISQRKALTHSLGLSQGRKDGWVATFADIMVELASSCSFSGDNSGVRSVGTTFLSSVALLMRPSLLSGFGRQQGGDLYVREGCRSLSSLNADELIQLIRAQSAVAGARVAYGRLSVASVVRTMDLVASHIDMGFRGGALNHAVFIARWLRALPVEDLSPQQRRQLLAAGHSYRSYANHRGRIVMGLWKRCRLREKKIEVQRAMEVNEDDGDTMGQSLVEEEHEVQALARDQRLMDGMRHLRADFCRLIFSTQLFSDIDNAPDASIGTGTFCADVFCGRVLYGLAMQSSRDEVRGVNEKRTAHHFAKKLYSRKGVLASRERVTGCYDESKVSSKSVRDLSQSVEGATSTEGSANGHAGAVNVRSGGVPLRYLPSILSSLGLFVGGYGTTEVKDERGNAAQVPLVTKNTARQMELMDILGHAGVDAWKRAYRADVVTDINRCVCGARVDIAGILLASVTRRRAIVKRKKVQQAVACLTDLIDSGVLDTAEDAIVDCDVLVAGVHPLLRAPLSRSLFMVAHAALLHQDPLTGFPAAMIGGEPASTPEVAAKGGFAQKALSSFERASVRVAAAALIEGLLVRYGMGHFFTVETCSSLVQLGMICSSKYLGSLLVEGLMWLGLALRVCDHLRWVHHVTTCEAGGADFAEEAGDIKRDDGGKVRLPYGFSMRAFVLERIADIHVRMKNLGQAYFVYRELAWMISPYSKGRRKDQLIGFVRQAMSTRRDAAVLLMSLHDPTHNSMCDSRDVNFLEYASGMNVVDAMMSATLLHHPLGSSGYQSISGKFVTLGTLKRNLFGGKKKKKKKPRKLDDIPPGDFLAGGTSLRASPRIDVTSSMTERTKERALAAAINVVDPLPRDLKQARVSCLNQSLALAREVCRVFGACSKRGLRARRQLAFACYVVGRNVAAQRRRKRIFVKALSILAKLHDDEAGVYKQGSGYCDDVTNSLTDGVGEATPTEVGRSKRASTLSTADVPEGAVLFGEGAKQAIFDGVSVKTLRLTAAVFVALEQYAAALPHVESAMTMTRNRLDSAPAGSMKVEKVLDPLLESLKAEHALIVRRLHLTIRQRKRAETAHRDGPRSMLDSPVASDDGLHGFQSIRGVPRLKLDEIAFIGNKSMVSVTGVLPTVGALSANHYESMVLREAGFQAGQGVDLTTPRSGSDDEGAESGDSSASESGESIRESSLRESSSVALSSKAVSCATSTPQQNKNKGCVDGLIAKMDPEVVDRAALTESVRCAMRDLWERFLEPLVVVERALDFSTLLSCGDVAYDRPMCLYSRKTAVVPARLDVSIWRSSDKGRKRKRKATAIASVGERLGREHSLAMAAMRNFVQRQLRFMGIDAWRTGDQSLLYNWPVFVPSQHGGMSLRDVALMRERSQLDGTGGDAEPVPVKRPGTRGGRLAHSQGSAVNAIAIGDDESYELPDIPGTRGGSRAVLSTASVGASRGHLRSSGAIDASRQRDVEAISDGEDLEQVQSDEARYKRAMDMAAGASVFKSGQLGLHSVSDVPSHSDGFHCSKDAGAEKAMLMMSVADVGSRGGSRTVNCAGSGNSLVSAAGLPRAAGPSGMMKRRAAGGGVKHSPDSKWGVGARSVASSTRSAGNVDAVSDEDEQGFESTEESEEIEQAEQPDEPVEYEVDEKEEVEDRVQEGQGDDHDAFVEGEADDDDVYDDDTMSEAASSGHSPVLHEVQPPSDDGNDDVGDHVGSHVDYSADDDANGDANGEVSEVRDDASDQESVGPSDDVGDEEKEGEGGLEEGAKGPSESRRNLLTVSGVDDAHSAAGDSTLLLDDGAFDRSAPVSGMDHWSAIDHSASGVEDEVAEGESPASADEIEEADMGYGEEDGGPVSVEHAVPIQRPQTAKPHLRPQPAKPLGVARPQTAKPVAMARPATANRADLARPRTAAPTDVVDPHERAESPPTSDKVERLVLDDAGEGGWGEGEWGGEWGEGGWDGGWEKGEWLEGEAAKGDAADNVPSTILEKTDMSTVAGGASAVSVAAVGDAIEEPRGVDAGPSVNDSEGLSSPPDLLDEFGLSSPDSRLTTARSAVSSSGTARLAVKDDGGRVRPTTASGPRGGSSRAGDSVGKLRARVADADDKLLSDDDDELTARTTNRSEGPGISDVSSIGSLDPTPRF